jgi:predicted anti-sigma-YlaC factor YlaD
MRRAILFAGLLPFVFLNACSIKKYAINQLGNALSGMGDTFASDDDPDLIRGAIPFSLKLVETLLAENPRQEGLLLAAAKGFTQYSYAFVQEDADETEDRAAAVVLRARAAKLYIRARNYGLRGLELHHPDFISRLKQDPKQAVKDLKKSEVPMAYWTALSWAAALSASRDFTMLPEIPRFEALTDRVLELDEAYEGGVIHTFLITYEMARLNAKTDKVDRARQHYERAVTLGGGKQAGPLVGYAENVMVVQKNKVEFQSLLNQAVKLDLNLSPDNRQLNLVMQRRARWLLSRTDKLFPQ